MGSESSSMRGFTLQEPPWTHPSGLTIYPAQLQEGRPASVFVYQPDNQDKVDKAAKHLKTLRHPCLLRFLSCTMEDGIYLVTERVQPVEMHLQKLSANEICAGIYDILQAIVFLHERGKVSHNNICLSSVFVSEDGHWKLGGMEMVCKLTEVVPESAEFGVLPLSLSHARDAFLFGRLVESLLAHVGDHFLTDSQKEHLEKDLCPQEIEDAIKACSAEVLSSFKNTVKKLLMNPEPECRPALSTLLNHDFFRNDFLKTVNFLESLTVKTEEEKNEFFNTLLDRVSPLPEELISSRLVPLLLNPFVFAEPMAVKSFLPHLLRPKRDIMGRNREGCLLSPALFQAKVIPVLMKMFEVHEEHVRVVLLTHIDAYGELFTLKELKDIILPQVLLGLRDTSDLLVSVTLRGLAALVCLLGPEVVVGGGRVKIFKSTTPGFTKITDTTPDGSPIHAANNHLNLATQNSLSTLLAKSNFPGVNLNCLTNEDLHLQDSLKEFRRKDFPTERSHLSRSMNDLLGVHTTFSLKSEVQQSPEDWPEWTESDGFMSDNYVNIQQNTKEMGDNPDPKQWVDDCPKPGTAHVSNQASVYLNDKGFLSWNAAFSLDNIADSSNSHSHKQSPSIVLATKPAQEKVSEKNVESWNTLGDEFTIKVKSKSKDPELDWFADMAPEIDLSTAFSSLGYHEETVNELDPNLDPNDKQSTTISKKFAAAVIEEGEKIPCLEVYVPAYIHNSSG
ncbi:protein-associating with the carboxyl-terminal domain of ezrin isoform X2 [Bufo gargarizans]|uniref:protein-associating with the carboxyl-terminal domain of ezrin isoform X2 n=1 Tax=Bufo gargarizans TaxID=30331 RepID=UPI001CF1F2A5|nr:protein-associating with the carboxyl-terminal domain of ezrin isoform X2 [Bufo gargarizans]